MVTILNIFLIATLAVMGIAIFQAAQIVKRGKNEEKPSETQLRRLERRLNVIHIGVYILVVILVFRIYMMIAA